MIPEGKYVARAVSHDHAQSSNGNDQIFVTFEIVGGPYGGQTITWFATFTDKTEERLVEGLRAAGWRGDDAGNLIGLGDVDCEIVVEHQKGTKDPSRMFATVRWVNKIGGRGIKVERPMTDKQKRAFATRMKALARRTPEVERDAPAPEGSNDVPF